MFSLETQMLDRILIQTSRLVINSSTDGEEAAFEAWKLENSLCAAISRVA